MRVGMLEFLDTDVFNVSAENCVSFLDSLIESWDIDLATFGMEVVLNRRLIPGYAKKIEFVETGPIQPQEEPGLKEFLRKQSLGIPATDEEIAFLKKLRFNGKRPTLLYYYRELQSLRDPLHFHVHNHSFSCSARKIFGWSSRGRSPTSSRKNVPGWANSRRPESRAINSLPEPV
jgi:hypothetical protein